MQKPRSIDEIRGSGSCLKPFPTYPVPSFKNTSQPPPFETTTGIENTTEFPSVSTASTLEFLMYTGIFVILLGALW